MWPTCTQREDLLLDNYSWVDRVAGQGEDSDRAGDGVDCAARIAGGAGRRTGAADDRRHRSRLMQRAADQWICAHRHTSRTRPRPSKPRESNDSSEDAVVQSSVLAREQNDRIAGNGKEQNTGRSKDSVRRAIALAVLALRCSTCSLAPGAGLELRRQADGPVQRQAAAILNGVGIAQHLNQQLPLALTFTDDAGKQVQLASYFGKKPGDSGAGLLPVPDALLGRVERADGRAADGERCSRQGLQRDRGEHRSQRGNGPGRGQEAQLS